MTTQRVTVSVDGESFETDIITRQDPTVNAPGGDGHALNTWGRFAIDVPESHAHLIGSHKDFGKSIELTQGSTVIDVVMLMNSVGGPGNCYVCVETEAYDSWSGMQDYPQQ